MDPAGLEEAEKALRKYPHYFSIVFECALLYGVYDIRIGHIMSAKGDFKGADECLSCALIKQLGDRMTLIMGKLNCYLKLNDYTEAKALIDAALSGNES